ncbi:MAG TPA: squalene synthase HpnC [bacterium]|nr:squalene synthase HpnC [bacterium]
MDPSIPSELGEAYAACQKQAFGHYENFPVASLLLPKESQPHVAALYAFARTADDFADEEEYEGRRLKEINLWEKGLKDALKGKKAPPVLMAFAHTLRTFNISPFLPFSLLKAYRMDVANHRYSTWNSLLYYCRHSANPVGRMVLLISGIQDEKLYRSSDFICSGLQLINFWQDTAIDLKRKRIYYPLQELKKAGVRERNLLALEDSPEVRRMVQNAVDYTERFFQKGLPLLDAVPGRLKLELKATYLGGSGILKKIRRMDYNVLQHRPAWSAFDKVSLAWKALWSSPSRWN